MRVSPSTRPPADSAPSSSSDASRRVRAHPRSSYRRARIVGLALSVLMHGLIFLLFWRTAFVPEPMPPSSAAHAPSEGGARALRLYSIRPVEDAAELETTSPPPEPEPEPALPVPRSPVEGPPGEPAAEPGDAAGTESAVDMLRPRMADPRLWQRVEPPPERELSDIDRARIRLYSRLGALNDSLAMVAESQRRATDWTIEDANGGRWGISPGKLHLGDRTIPLPFGFSPPPGQREEMAERRSKDGEIRRQSELHDVEQSGQDRAGAIRGRRDAERKGKDTSTASGSGGGAASGSSGGTGTGTGSGSSSGSGGGAGTGSGGGSSSGGGGGAGGSTGTGGGGGGESGGETVPGDG